MERYWTKEVRRRFYRDRSLLERLAGRSGLEGSGLTRVFFIVRPKTLVGRLTFFVFRRHSNRD